MERVIEPETSEQRGLWALTGERAFSPHPRIEFMGRHTPTGDGFDRVMLQREKRTISVACADIDSANFSAQYLHRPKCPVFVFIFEMVRQILRFGAGEGIRTLDPNLGNIQVVTKPLI